jgi:hypothetical protein
MLLQNLHRSKRFFFRRLKKSLRLPPNATDKKFWSPQLVEDKRFCSPQLAGEGKQQKTLNKFRTPTIFPSPLNKLGTPKYV